MNVEEAIRKRRSIRKYQHKQFPREVLLQLLEAARIAPSSSNLQAWDIVVVQDDELKKKLSKASGNQAFVGECSAYLVGVAKRGVYYEMVDLAIALDHLSLRAVELGLGTCWIGDFDPNEISNILGIPKDVEVMICMTVGYPAIEPRARPRKSLEGLFHNDVWRKRLK